MKKAIIIEDEVNSQKILQTLIERYLEDVEVVRVLSSNAETIEFFQEAHTPIDLAFLDINLLDGIIFKSLDVLPQINFHIIFVTAYEEYAIRAFDYSAVGYILKPIDHDSLIKAYERLPEASTQELTKQMDVLKDVYGKHNTFSKITISALDGIYFLEMKDIVRLEAEDNYTYIYTTTQPRITASKTIKTYEDLLNPFNFYRVHKSFIINMNHIAKFKRKERSIFLKDGTRIEVARRRMAEFSERLENLRGRY